MGRSRLTASDEHVIPHPPEWVYRVLCDIGSYPEWWPPAGSVHVLGPLPVQVGTKFRLSRTPLVRWTVEVLEMWESRGIVMRYAGPLRGAAWWWLTADGMGGTRVVYAMDIEATALWLRLVFLLWNLQSEHSRQIRRICDALALRVGAMRQRAHIHPAAVQAG
jgi:uncharacterized protein YndB with AHSA1/START domain